MILEWKIGAVTNKELAKTLNMLAATSFTSFGLAFDAAQRIKKNVKSNLFVFIKSNDEIFFVEE